MEGEIFLGLPLLRKSEPRLQSKAKVNCSLSNKTISPAAKGKVFYSPLLHENTSNNLSDLDPPWRFQVMSL
eukprot:8409052-Ditylum_brightwellii.AAC.1